MNSKNWEILERDDDRGFETLAREVDDGWEVEVRFDDTRPPKRDSHSAKSRDEARKVGQEIFMTS